MFWGGGILNKESQPEQINIETENVNLAIYLENEQTTSIPSKDSGYYFDREKSSCTNDAYMNWDSVSWSPIIKNVSNYPVRCNLYFKTEYNESILNGAYPVLEEPLIAVTIESDGTVKRADLGSKWYSYEEKIWANAIILKDETKDYKSTEVIPEEAIESYFVWIPKYRYQLWDLGQYDSLTSIDTNKVHEIPIIFGDYNTSDNIEGECTTPMESGATGNCNVGDYMTHPAFLSIPSKGFWVGKFETGYEGATTVVESEVNERDASKIIVKPNVYSWRGIQVANAFYTSYDYKRNLDSHMMKNTEWGAVAYLQHSAYGSATSVRINNNTDFITGYAANNEPTCGYTGTNEECNRSCNDESCNTAYPNSTLASTTRNISGIFDLNGGAWEYTMGIMIDENGNPMSGNSNEANSGFVGSYGDGGINSNGSSWPSQKYYDIYQFNTNESNYVKRILGDATGEMGSFDWAQNLSVTRIVSSWYSGYAYFYVKSFPICLRSMYYGAGNMSGVFAFNNDTGEAHADTSFRLVLTPS